MNDAWDHIPLTPLSYGILLSLAAEALHGYGILKAMEALSGGRFVPDTGTLYTGIRRLRSTGLLEAESASEGRRGASYALTPLGRRVLTAETERLDDLVREARRNHVLTRAPQTS